MEQEKSFLREVVREEHVNGAFKRERAFGNESMKKQRGGEGDGTALASLILLFSAHCMLIAF